MRKNFQIVFVPLLLLCLACSQAFAAEPTEKAPEVTVKFEAHQLWQLFRNDQSKAEQELIGKTIQITGMVVETGMSIYLTPNVRLSNTSDNMVYVTCVLPRGDTALLSNFTKGEQVTMSGRVYRFSPRTETVVIKESKRVVRKVN